MPGEAVTFGRYIEHLDLLYGTTDRLRREMSLRLYQHPLDCWNYPEACDTIMTAYPRNSMEWTAEAQRLLRLLENAQGSRQAR